MAEKTSIRTTAEAALLATNLILQELIRALYTRKLLTGAEIEQMGERAISHCLDPSYGETGKQAALLIRPALEGSRKWN